MQGGSAGYWITNADFGAATTAATTPGTYLAAVNVCKGAAALANAQALYDLEVNAGVSKSDAADEIANLDGGNDPYTGTSAPSAGALEAAFTAEVTTVAASSVTQTQAQLNGTLALTSPTSAHFEYGTSTTGTLTSTPPVSSPTSPTSAVVTGLTCGTTYYFRVVGTNSTATYYGQFLSFTTAACGGGGSGGGGSGGGSSTPSPTPSTPPASPPSTPPGNGPVKKPETEKVKPGDDVTLIDGEPSKTEKKKDDKSTKVEVKGPDFELTLGGTTPGGNPLPLSPSGAPIVTPQEKLSASGTGCSPGTSVQVYLLNPLTSLGTFTVGADGSFSGSVGLPAGLSAGDYVVQTNCTTKTEQVRSVSIGVTVRSAALKLCYDGTTGGECAKLAQRPKAGVIILPDELVGGRNLLVPSRIRMNSGQFADVKVLCSPVTRSAPVGDVAYCQTTRKGKATYVLVRPNMQLRATVIITAPETATYAAYKFTKKYKISE